MRILLKILRALQHYSLVAERRRARTRPGHLYRGSPVKTRDSISNRHRRQEKISNRFYRPPHHPSLLIGTPLPTIVVGKGDCPRRLGMDRSNSAIRLDSYIRLGKGARCPRRADPAGRFALHNFDIKPDIKALSFYSGRKYTRSRNKLATLLLTW
jgi:hypothetical protein